MKEWLEWAQWVLECWTPKMRDEIKNYKESANTKRKSNVPKAKEESKARTLAKELAKSFHKNGNFVQ